MAELKREYVVPLRRKTSTAPKWRRTKKAMSVLKDFIKKHMKTDNVIICSELNEAIWSRGIKNPPGKVSIVALKTQIAGKEGTLVNLASVGLDAQLKTYATEEIAPQKEEVKEAEVKEVETKADKKAVKETKEEVKEKTESSKKEESSEEEVKKDE